MNSYEPRRYRFSLHGQSWFDRRVTRRQRHRTQTRPVAFSTPEAIDLEPIVDPENLLLALCELKRSGGAAPGLDGTTFQDLTTRQRGALCRRVSQLIREGNYRPGAAREVRIPKSKGGFRTLKIRNIIDRTVSKALTLALTPALDTQMLDCSFGFRPERNTHQLLAEVINTLRQGTHLVMVTEDIEAAFDHVSITTLMDCLATHIRDSKTLQLMQTVLQGQEGALKLTGIDQGDPLSPFCLNVLLDYLLDRPFLTAFPDIPFWRYADDLTFACQNEREAHDVLIWTQQQLHRYGMKLKGGKHPVPLRRQGARANILGFQLSYPDQSKFRLELATRSWKKLEESLAALHHGTVTRTQVEAICRGWIQAHGPAFEDSREISSTLSKLLRCLSRTGFSESISQASLITELELSKQSWRSTCLRIWQHRSICSPCSAASLL
ncbi:MAG: reverse transcriptase domain-containing protein [Gemmataceae bacterium]